MISQESRTKNYDRFKGAVALGLLVIILILLLQGRNGTVAEKQPAAEVPTTAPSTTVPPTTAPPTTAPTAEPSAQPSAQPTAQPTVIDWALPVLNAPQFAADGTLSLSGTGEPGATVELWAGEVKLGSVPVGADGTWSWAGEVDPGDYALTARTVDAAGQALNESASLALTVEVSTPAPGTAETVSPEESGEGEGYVVQPGDSLSALAARFYENGQLWRLIFDATNAKAAEDPTFQVIDNPNFIRPGWRLWIPAQ